MTGVLQIANGCRNYAHGSETIHALRRVDLSISSGECVALVGPSGSGKSTLLLALAGWERLDDGEVRFSEDGVTRSPADLLWTELAVVPQLLGLVPELTVEENVMLPIRLSHRSCDVRHVRDWMRDLDVYKLRSRDVLETSLGEQQRTAVCRAVAHSPKILLADEPTSHQGLAHASVVAAAVRRLAEQGCAVVIATHDGSLYRHADRVVHIQDGLIQPGS